MTSGDYATALREFTPFAEQGNASSAVPCRCYV